MNHISKIILSVAFAALFAVTVAAFIKEGWNGMITPFKASLWTWQYFIDLVVALVLVMFWIAKDCRAKGKSPIPWIIATFLTGSFAPLAYLLVQKRQPAK